MNLYTATFGPNPDQPREQWNNSWERAIVAFYEGPQLRYSGPLSLAEPKNLLAYGHSLLVKDILDLQNDLVFKATLRLRCDDLENKWTSFTVSQRREFCLEGLFTACTVYGVDLGMCRKWCPELTLDSLSSQPEKYLALVRRFASNDLENKITTPIMVVNATVDTFIRYLPEIDIERHLYERTFYLSMMVWRTLLAIYGETERGNVIRGPAGSRKRDLPKALREMYKATMGDGEYREMFRDIRQSQITDNRSNHYCEACRRTAEAIQESGGAPLRRCPKCRKAGRTVEYCSRECQVKDWKTGEPVSHKEICGKALTNLPAIDFAAHRARSPRFQDDLVPQPAPGFKRSPLLLKQMQTVQTPPYYADYILLGETPFLLNDDRERELFMVVRRRAFRDGDERSVSELYTILKPYLQQHDIPLDAFRSQLRKEYELTSIDCSITPGDIRPATDEETACALRAVAIGGARGVVQQKAPWVPQPQGWDAPAALQRQVEFLRKPPFADYVVFRPVPYDDLAMGQRYPLFRRILLAARRRAIESGDRSAVAYLFSSVSRLLKVDFPNAMGALEAQFKQEYGVTSEELATAAEFHPKRHELWKAEDDVKEVARATANT
ncbi:hypothetical protein K523DRAFT_358034 [Schizophyllum commune Tattone D]|nr:hypothetical protein K523DRAFT_358034 [Schizophyllum commune Tattone D]